ncbi:putative ABC transporter ATP-binding protein [Minicystis rosea]|nr:putative ABC transporter ATP-binding protein [Minicystis rosea]
MGLFRQEALAAHQATRSAGEVLRVSPRWISGRLFDRIRRRRRTPFVQQLTASDCGAASLAMVLRHHGKAVPLDDLRELTGVGRDGAKASAIIEAARVHGLRARGVRVELDALVYLAAPAILHWNFDHFVVFERHLGDAIEILDPGMGPRRIRLEDVSRSFTGVALLFEPGADFVRDDGRGDPGVDRSILANVRQSGPWGKILGLSVLLHVVALAAPVLTGLIVDRVLLGGRRDLLPVISAALVALVLFQLVAGIVRGHLLLFLRVELERRMTTRFLEHLVRLPFAFFQRRTAGDLLARTSSNASIREMLTTTALSGVLDGALVSLYLAVLLAASPRMGAVVIGLGALQVAVLLSTRARQRELTARSLHVQAQHQSYQMEVLSGMETLKAMGAEDKALHRWADLFVDTLNVAVEQGRLDAISDAITSAIRFASPLVILGYGALQVLRGEVTIGAMLGLAALASGFLVPLGNLVSTGGQLHRLTGYLDRIGEVLRAAPEQDRAAAQRPSAFHGRITFDRVTFCYTNGARPTLRDVSIDIEPGELVAVVGRSGSGKSTLAGLIHGLYKPTSGRVLVDGADLATLDLPTLRGRCGIVTQRPFLFNGSIRANIAFSDPFADLDKISAAAKRAAVDEEIAAMPMGYHTLLCDGGASLSGGQRQRVALARALLGEPRVLLLDEATSALDAITERRVFEEIAKLRATRIVIAHRLSTVRAADRILVMDDGRLVEQGTHDELVARRGVYFELVSAQIEEETASPSP